jgi:hypothetical protein
MRIVTAGMLLLCGHGCWGGMHVEHCRTVAGYTTPLQQPSTHHEQVRELVDPPSTSFRAAVTVACACCSWAAGAPVLLGRGLGLGLALTPELLLLELEIGLGLGFGLGLGEGLLGGRGTLVA